VQCAEHTFRSNPVMLTLAERIQIALDAGYTNAQLAKAAGVTRSAASQWLVTTKKLKAESVLGLAQLTGWRAAWWSSGVGPKEQGPPLSRSPLAHLVTLDAHTVIAPLIGWEAIVSDKNLTGLFRCAMPDDSALPKYPKGVEVLWDTGRQAKPGRLVLVRDKHDQVHVREYRQDKAPGQWLAVPLNAAYASLDCVEDGLSIVAVFKGVLEPDD